MMKVPIKSSALRLPNKETTMLFYGYNMQSSNRSRRPPQVAVAAATVCAIPIDALAAGAGKAGDLCESGRDQHHGRAESTNMFNVYESENTDDFVHNLSYSRYRASRTTHSKWSPGGFNPALMELETASYSAIPRQSLTSAVADKLRDQIIRGEIPEGAQLRQDAIATQYQVSRIPVREALRQLDAEGLISIVPNRGAIVPALSPADIEELFSIRALLEPEVLKLSIPRLSEEDFVQAAAVLRKYVGELRREDHVSAWGRLNWQFHSILYSRANQPRSMAIIRNVNNSGERYTRLQLYLTQGMKRANEEHHQMLEFCRQGDVVAACDLLREHIRYAGESLKRVLEQKRAESQIDAGNGSRKRKN